MKLSNQFKATLQHKLMLAGKRIIPTFFFENAPDMFVKWQFNACRQTAIWVCDYLSQLDEFKGRTIGLYEGVFDDEMFGRYDHAYVYVWPKDGEDGLFVDVSRVSIPCMVEWVKAENEGLDQFPNVELMVRRSCKWAVAMISEVGVDWNSILDQKEYYTNLEYRMVNKLISRALNLYTRK